MDATIGYLELIREDLLDAGAREARGGRARLPRVSGRTLAAAVAAITLLAAGSLGWWVTEGDRMERATPASDPGSVSATGSTGGGERLPTLFEDEQAGLADLDAGYSPLVPGTPPADVPSTTLPGEVTRVIRTAELGIVISRGSFDERFADAVDIASANDGFVSTSTSQQRAGNITMRVPSATFAETLGSLRELGDVQVQSVHGKDVTASYVDLHARLRIARSRREVLLGLMSEANSIEQTIRVQNALDETQLRIEELQGNLRLLDDRTSLATISLDLREQGVEPQAEVEKPSIPNAFERSAAGFVGVIAGVVIGLGYLIPVLLLALAGWFVVSRVRRRRTA
jgi:Domain of unknown function (DUF4349)